MITILVVDDHPVFLEGVAASLSRVSDFIVVGVATTGEEAVSIGEALRPDIVLMDLNLPGISGVEATRRLTAVDSGPRVLALTMVDDDETVLAALRAGAAGYILKGASGEEIAAATRTAASGGAVFGAGIAARILASAAHRAGRAVRLANRPRARCPRHDRRGIEQRADRAWAGPVTEDGPELRVPRAGQAPGNRPHSGRDPGARGPCRISWQLRRRLSAQVTVPNQSRAEQ